MSAALFLVACGGGGNSPIPSTNNSPQTGSLSIAITDAPIDEAQAVNITFTGLTIKPASGDEINFTFDAKNINLMDYQNGSGSAPLIEGENVTAGAYNWIRLTIDESQSTITLSDGTVNPLTVPSGAETGLKLVSGFTVAQGGTNNFTIDFDLSKSIVKPASANQNYKLKPALRLVDNQEVGSIMGVVTPEIVGKYCSEGNWGAIYYYEGIDVTPLSLYGDNPGTETIESTNVFVRGKVESTPNDEGKYTFAMGFLPPGDYTIAYTCDNLEDRAYESDETDPLIPEVAFHGAQNVSVNAGQTTSDIIFDLDTAQ